MASAGTAMDAEGRVQLMAKLKDNFVGKGSMETFCNETNKLFKAVNNPKFIMPSGYSGAEPTLRIEGERLAFDFGEALIFTLNNVQWNLTGSATFNSYSVSVVNGQLVISVDAD